MNNVCWHASICIVQLCVGVVYVCVQVGECTCGDCVMMWLWLATVLSKKLIEFFSLHRVRVRAFTFASPLHTWQEVLVLAHLALCALSWCGEGKRRVSECG